MIMGSSGRLCGADSRAQQGRFLDGEHAAKVPAETAARAVHDMNNVLAAIMANAYFLRQAAPDNPDVARCAEAIERSAEAGARIVAEAMEERRSIPA